MIKENRGARGTCNLYKKMSGTPFTLSQPKNPLEIIIKPTVRFTQYLEHKMTFCRLMRIKSLHKKKISRMDLTETTIKSSGFQAPKQVLSIELE
jgi:hypothetical protein